MFGFGAKYESISTEELNESMENGSLLIDIRNEEAYKEGHIKNAINIPIKSLPAKLKELDMSKNYLVICYIGGSSKAATKIMVKAGFNVKNVNGGMKSWNGPLVTK